MCKCDLLRAAHADQAAAGSALRAGRMFASIVPFALMLEHSTCHGVDLIVVLVAAGNELHVVVQCPIIPVKLDLELCRIRFFHIGVLQRGLLRLLSADHIHAALRPAASNCVRADASRRLIPDDLARYRIHIVLILRIYCVEFHFIHHAAMLAVQLHFEAGNVRFCKARMFERRLDRRIRADVCLVARLADRADMREAYIFCKQVQLVDGKPRKLRERVARIALKNLLDQRSFADGDAVFRGLCRKRIVRAADVLAQDRAAADPALCENRFHFCNELAFKRLRICSIHSLHRDENGVRQLVKIAEFEHRAHDCVHRHIQLRSRKLHSIEHRRAVFIVRFRRKHIFFRVHAQFHAGVHIEGDDRRNVRRQRRLPGSAADQHAHNKQRRSRRDRRTGAQHLVFAPVFIRILFHIDYRSFLLIALAQDILQHIGRRVGNGIFQFGFDLVPFHFSSASIACFSFLTALAYLESTVARGISRSAALSLWRSPATACSITICRSASESCRSAACRISRSSAETPGLEER